MRKTDFRPLTSEERIPSFPMLAKGHRRMDAHPHVEHRLPSEIRSTCGAHNKHQHGMIDWVPWTRIEMAQVCTIKRDDPQRYAAHIISYDHMCGQNTGPVLMSTYMHTYVQNSLQTNSHRMFSICGKCLAPRVPTGRSTGLHTQLPVLTEVMSQAQGQQAQCGHLGMVFLVPMFFWCDCATESWGKVSSMQKHREKQEGQRPRESSGRPWHICGG